MVNTRLRWWQALDPPIYLISILPGAAVWLLTGIQGQRLAEVATATLAVVLLQHAINVLNDVSDWRLGADIDKRNSWVRFHDEIPRTAAIHGFFSLILGALLGLAVLIVAGKTWITLVAAPLVLLGYLYNSGSRPLSYTHLGEWVTGLCYGPGVFGCLWLLAATRPIPVGVFGSIAFFALSVALLLSHQPPQIDTDRRAGKLSFAVRFGARRTYIGAKLLFLLFLLALGLALSSSDPDTASRITYNTSAVIAGLLLVWLQPMPRRLLPVATAVILGTLLAGAGDGFL
ncbi:MAG: prenyltransferase [Gammaproteobacteria bacterium]|jgi:1,4-dihydroxy-2-naphthoate octaprenyltransferase